MAADPTPLQIVKHLRQFIRDALVQDGGTGGRRHCRYCLRESYPGQVEHYRVDVEGEANEPCEVTVIKAAIKLLTKRGR